MSMAEAGSKVKRTKVQGRVPLDMAEALQKIADEQFGGNHSDALAYALSVGLSELTGEEFDPGLDAKPSNDDVAPFREWLIAEVHLSPVQATQTASWVRRAYRSGDPRAFNEDPALEPKVRGSRMSAWRYWVEYCISNGVNWQRVHVAGA
jgi:hypothetical protein